MTPEEQDQLPEGIHAQPPVVRASRMAATQPTYDFLSGPNGHEDAGTSSPLRVSTTRRPLGQSVHRLVDVESASDASPANQEYRAKIKTLQYELDALKQQQERDVIKHDRELRDAVAAAEERILKIKAHDKSEFVPVAKYEDISAQLKETQDGATNAKLAVDKELRRAKEEVKAAQEDATEAREDLVTLGRQVKQNADEAAAKTEMLELELNEARSKLVDAETCATAMRRRVGEKDDEIGRLEGDLLKTRIHADDFENVNVIKEKLSEQVEYIQKLELSNRERESQVQMLQRNQQRVEIVQEQKRSLEIKLGDIEELHQELAEHQLQRSILEEEKRAWTSYLDAQNLRRGSGEHDDSSAAADRYKTPEDVARALVKQEVENVNLQNQIGLIRAELVERDMLLSHADEEQSKLKTALKAAQAASQSTTGSTPANTNFESRARRALERQCALAREEVGFLREQMRTFDTEEQTFHAESSPFDALKARRIAELESQVDAHRQEMSRLTQEMSMLEAKVASHQAEVAATPTQPSDTRKRARPEDGQEGEEAGSTHTAHTGPHASPSRQASEMQQRCRKLQDEVLKLQNVNALLQADQTALKTQLKASQASSKTRILSLRSNPAAKHAAIKQETLRTLQQENRDLLSRLEAPMQGMQDQQQNMRTAIPDSTLDSLRLEIDELTRLVADKEKRMLRLKQIWAAKSLEFREAVFSLLGWRMDFRPNGKFALSLQTGNEKELGASEDAAGQNAHPAAEDQQNAHRLRNQSASAEETLIFDGENGTMKVAGGMDCAFAQQLRPLTKEWVENKRYIPGLMASILLSKIDDGTVMI